MKCTYLRSVWWRFVLRERPPITTNDCEGDQFPLQSCSGGSDRWRLRMYYFCFGQWFRLRTPPPLDCEHRTEPNRRQKGTDNCVYREGFLCVVCVGVVCLFFCCAILSHPSPLLPFASDFWGHGHTPVCVCGCVRALHNHLSIGVCTTTRRERRSRIIAHRETTAATSIRDFVCEPHFAAQSPQPHPTTVGLPERTLSGLEISHCYSSPGELPGFFFGEKDSKEKNQARNNTPIAVREGH